MHKSGPDPNTSVAVNITEEYVDKCQMVGIFFFKKTVYFKMQKI